jgi:hypothetical protein
MMAAGNALTKSRSQAVGNQQLTNSKIKDAFQEA